MKKIYQVPDAINLADLSKLVNKNPQYAKMFSGLAQIDNYIKKFIDDIISNHSDASIYYIKTEIKGPCYNLYLYNSEVEATVGVSWLLADFLEKCENKTIEFEINSKVLTMLNKFNTKLDSNNTTWIN